MVPPDVGEPSRTSPQANQQGLRRRHKPHILLIKMKMPCLNGARRHQRAVDLAHLKSRKPCQRPTRQAAKFRKRPAVFHKGLERQKLHSLDMGFAAILLTEDRFAHVFPDVAQI